VVAQGVEDVVFKANPQEALQGQGLVERVPTGPELQEYVLEGVFGEGRYFKVPQAQGVEIGLVPPVDGFKSFLIAPFGEDHELLVRTITQVGGEHSDRFVYEYTDI
jgi:hypothetical protein